MRAIMKNTSRIRPRFCRVGITLSEIRRKTRKATKEYRKATGKLPEVTAVVPRARMPIQAQYFTNFMGMCL
jgi:hypothetical protein